jgi:hypothetical protein
MARMNKLYPPIFRIDVDAAQSFFGGEVPIEDIPQRIIDVYNASKDVTTYEREGTAIFQSCHLIVYRNVTVRGRLNPWISFYEPSGISITRVWSQTITSLAS